MFGLFDLSIAVLIGYLRAKETVTRLAILAVYLLSLAVYGGVVP